MSMEYIRKAYGVPARRGGRILYRGKEHGVIVGPEGQYLRMRMDNERVILSYHPTWGMRYLSGENHER